MKQLIILLILITIIITGCNNVRDIDRNLCAEYHRANTNVVFCDDLKGCMKDCEMFNGNFIMSRYQGDGFNKVNLCYCNVSGEIKNIWWENEEEIKWITQTEKKT